jgi:hypothetical protein
MNDIEAFAEALSAYYRGIAIIWEDMPALGNPEKVAAMARAYHNVEMDMPVLLERYIEKGSCD